jgi:hypothetical protein
MLAADSSVAAPKSEAATPEPGSPMSSFRIAEASR